MLTPTTVIPYLLERGLVDIRSIVESDLAVYETSHRNTDFKVVSERGLSCMVKQGQDEGRAATIDHEARVYDFLASHPNGDAFRPFLPRCYYHDPEEHIIVLELVRNAENLESRHQRLGRFSTSIASELGRALGFLHLMTMKDGMHRKGSDRPLVQNPEGTGSSDLPQSHYLPPGVLVIHKPRLAFYNSVSSANIQLISIIQRFPEFGEILDELLRDWKSEVFIHGDIKWSNIVAAGRGSRVDLKIVDWELAGKGDPCWDAGSVFNDYLSLWLLSIPITGKDPPERFLELAGYPLVRMQPAIRAFWASYIRTMNLEGAAADQWLERAVLYCGSRLAQTALEESQTLSDLNGNIISFLQLGLNIMRRPQRAATRLLGIPWHQALAT